MHVAMAGFSVSKNGRIFFLGKSMDDNLRASIIDSSIAEGGGSSMGVFWRALLASCRSISSHESVRFNGTNLCLKFA